MISQNNKIKEIRQAAGLTQATLSEITGIPKRTIENWDAGVSKPPSWLPNMLGIFLDAIDKGEIENHKGKRRKKT